MASTKAISDGTCVKVVHPCRVIQNYSNSRVRGYGLLGELNLIIRQLEWILLKLAKISVSALVYLLVGKSRGASQRCNWLVVGNGLVYASYLILVIVVHD